MYILLFKLYHQILLIFLITVGFVLVRKLLTASDSLRSLSSKTPLLILAGVLLLILGLTGHLVWLTAIAGVLVAFVARNLPLLLRYAPQLQQFWRSLKNAQQAKNTGGYETPTRNKMTVTEAYNILGLKPPATKQEIILAHKKLMQKMHPDRGGSDYLASQINLAKDYLLKN